MLGNTLFCLVTGYCVLYLAEVVRMGCFTNTRGHGTLFWGALCQAGVPDSILWEALAWWMDRGCMLNTSQGVTFDVGLVG